MNLSEYPVQRSPYLPDDGLAFQDVAPLGLKLDKVGVMHQLTAMGMRVTSM